MKEIGTVIFLTKYLVDKAGREVPVHIRDYSFPLRFKMQRWLYGCCAVILLIGIMVTVRGINAGNTPGMWIGFAVIFASILAAIYLLRRVYTITDDTIIIQTMFTKRQIAIHQINNVDITDRHICLYLNNQERVELDPFISNLSLFLSLIREMALPHGKGRM